MPTTRSPSQVSGDGTNSDEGWSLHREGVTAVDTLPLTGVAAKKRGMNMQGYDTALIEVMPSGTANPTVTVLYWSQRLERFVREHTNLVFTGVGADTPFQFSVECRGRVMFVAVTTLAAGSVNIGVAGARTIIQPVA